MRSERGELARVSDPPSVYSVHNAAGDVWRAPTRLLLKMYLAAGVSETETKTLDRLPTGGKMIFLSIFTKTTGLGGRPLAP